MEDELVLEGILIGAFSSRGYLDLMKRGQTRSGELKLIQVARVSGPRHFGSMLEHLSRSFGGRVIQGRKNAWLWEVSTSAQIRLICRILSSSPIPIPKRLAEEVSIMLRFLEYTLEVGRGADNTEAYRGRFGLFLEMQSLHGR